MLMPVIGWAVGLSFADIISGFDHWIAFGLLAFIGAKMIYEGTKKEEDHNSPKDLKLQCTADFGGGNKHRRINGWFKLCVPADLNCASHSGYWGSNVWAFICRLLLWLRTGQSFGHRIEIVGGVVLDCYWLEDFAGTSARLASILVGLEFFSYLHFSAFAVVAY